MPTFRGKQIPIEGILPDTLFVPSTNSQLDWTLIWLALYHLLCKHVNPQKAILVAKHYLTAVHKIKSLSPNPSHYQRLNPFINNNLAECLEMIA